MIRIENLAKVYHGSDNKAIDNISLSIDEGEVFGLLGPNGAGKTTFINMLSGLLLPTAGSIHICNRNMKNHRSEILREVGAVPQDIALYPGFTALENLTVFGGVYGLKRKELRRRIKELIQLFGLEKKGGMRVSKYSGGMKRRLNIIAGILHRPRVLFLDEPTVGIDVQSKTVILENLKRLNNEGTTMIYTSHQMDEAEHFCTRIAIVDNGRIIIIGKPGELTGSSPGFNNLEGVYLHLTGKELRD
ncbi:MAG: ABC transporter ATP-binding protein [Bacteroidetes bacterium]|nr:ABC transporter ATP-binding protein [Bacteroidota bacterium]